MIYVRLKNIKDIKVKNGNIIFYSEDCNSPDGVIKIEAIKECYSKTGQYIIACENITIHIDGLSELDKIKINEIIDNKKPVIEITSFDASAFGGSIF